MKHIPRIIILFISLTFSLSAQTVVTDFKDIKFNLGTGSDVLTLPVAPNPIFSPLVQTIKSAKLYLLCNLGEDYKLGTKPFSVDVDVTVLGKNSSATTFTLQKQLKINNKGPEQLFVYDFLNNISNLTTFEVNVTSATFVIDPSLTPAVFDVRNNAHIKAYFEVEYGVDVRNSSQQLSVPIVNTLSNSKVTRRVQKFNWSADNFPDYQFELLRLYNTDNTKPDIYSVKTKIDWSKALRVETEKELKNLKLSVAEGTGFYVWRVRGIGNFYEGGIGNSQNWGSWSASPNDGDEVDISLSNLNLSNSPYLFLEDPDQDLNWIYSRTFTEGNSVSEKISYANGLLQSKQTQAYIKSRSKTIVSQTIQDYSGRPALTTMPVPVDTVMDHYQTGLVKKAGTSSLYTAADFDQDINSNSPSQVDKSTGTPYSYYSDINTDVNIPDAEGYPFSRNLYFNDATNRVKEQSGVGKRHSIGLQTNNQGRTTRTYFENPSEEELIRVFGDEAPAANSVIKTMTVDPNNTISITYTGKDGKVIATCIALNGGDTQLAVPDNESTTGFAVSNGTKTNVRSSNGFISTKRVAFAVPTPVNVGYTIGCNTPTLDCDNPGSSCNYKAKFFIHDIDRNISYESGEYSMDGVPCNIKMPVDFPTLPNGTLEPGNYVIEKQLYSGADKSAAVNSAVSKVEDGIQPIIGYFVGLLNSVKTEQDIENFYQTVQGISNDLVAAFASGDTASFYAAHGELHKVRFTSDDFIRLNPPYTPNNPNVRPATLEIKAGCCEAFSMSVKYHPQIICYTIPEMKADTAKRPHFEQYLLSEFPGSTMSQLLPGFLPGEFDTMIFRMLTDNDIIAMYGANGYSCNNLWKCWKAVISQYQQIVAGLNAAAGTNVMTSAENQDGSPSDMKSTLDEQKKNIKGWFMKFIIGLFLPDELEGSGNPNPNVIPAITASTDMAKLFFDCAGYKFTNVIVRPNGVPANLEASYNPNHALSRTATGLRYPYIKDCRFMFKYFEYTNGTVDNMLPSHPIVEVQNCFLNYDSLFKPFPMCGGPLCNHDYKQWSTTDRLMFYNSIKSVVKEEVGINAMHESGLDCPTDLTPYSLRRDTIITECKSTCESRRAEFKRDLEQTFSDKCYTIGGCPTDPGVVTEKDISLLVDSMVSRCQQYCEEMRVSGYPTCKKDTCIMWDGSSFTQLRNFNVMLMPDWAIKISEQVKYWRIETDIPGSMCNPLPTANLQKDFYSGNASCPAAAYSVLPASLNPPLSPDKYSKTFVECVEAP